MGKTYKTPTIYSMLVRPNTGVIQSEPTRYGGIGVHLRTVSEGNH